MVVVVHTFNQALKRQRWAEFFKSSISLIYRANSRTARAKKRGILSQKTKIKTKTKQTHAGAVS